MFWSIAVVVVVLGALALWLSGRGSRGVDHGSVQRARKIDEGRASEFGPMGP
jgi:hypothetical protein